MKIRVDFVTNSSSSSYVDIYADNPVLNELLAKYNGSADDAYMHYITDFCRVCFKFRLYAKSCKHNPKVTKMDENEETRYRGLFSRG